MDNLIIAGKRVALKAISDDQKRKLWLGLLAGFDLFVFEWEESHLLLLVGKNQYHATPAHSKNISTKIFKVLGMEAVFYYDGMPTYERDRLVDKGVYFIVGTKFAYMPHLLANRLMSNDLQHESLFPSSQYLLLYHLQEQSLEGTTIQELTEMLPYKYVTIAKSVRQLAALGLADISSIDIRTKQLSFNRDNRQLWIDALKYMVSPIKHEGYLSCEVRIGKIGGVEALSHYSMLVGEEIPTKVLTVAESKELSTQLSRIEDIQRIEIWKYPPISSDNYVDRLSLYLTLRDDNDPRVQKELETMLKGMQW